VCVSVFVFVCVWGGERERERERERECVCERVLSTGYSVTHFYVSNSVSFFY